MRAGPATAMSSYTLAAADVGQGDQVPRARQRRYRVASARSTRPRPADRRGPPVNSAAALLHRHAAATARCSPATPAAGPARRRSASPTSGSAAPPPAPAHAPTSAARPAIDYTLKSADVGRTSDPRERDRHRTRRHATADSALSAATVAAIPTANAHCPRSAASRARARSCGENGHLERHAAARLHLPVGALRPDLRLDRWALVPPYAPSAADVGKQAKVTVTAHGRRRRAAPSRR